MSAKKSNLLQGLGVFLNFSGEMSGIIGSMFTNFLFLGVTGPVAFGGVSTHIE
jgi:hypothetical protein